MKLVAVLLVLLLVAGVAQGSHGGPHPSTMTLIVPDMQVGAQAVLAAVLQHPNGDPEPRAEIWFEVETTFGWLSLGRRFTNAEGEATLEYTPPGPGTFTFRARFNGTSSLDPAEATATAFVAEGPTEGAPFPTVTAVAVVVGLVLGGIWGTYGFVLLQLRRIWIEGGGRPRVHARRGVRAR